MVALICFLARQDTGACAGWAQASVWLKCVLCTWKQDETGTPFMKKEGAMWSIPKFGLTCPARPERVQQKMVLKSNVIRIRATTW